MKNKKLNWSSVYFGFTVLFLLLISVTGRAQILRDTSTINLIKKGIGRIYNLEFKDAEAILTKLNVQYPGHPASYLYKGILIYYRNYPLLPANSESKNFEQQLQTGIQLCEAEEGWLDDPERLLIDLCSRGLLLLYYSENDLNREVIPMVISTYKCVMKSFEFTSVYPDFCYFTGLYNYYREAYPESHPVYKPVAMFFRSGDRERGMKELQYSAENSIVLNAESYSILSWINIYFEKNYPKALDYSKTLHRRYPSNLLFRSEYLKTLLLLKKYDEAEKLMSLPATGNNSYYTAQLAIFNGLIQEKKYQNIKEAERFYTRGINDLKKFNERGKEFREFGNKGLKRLEGLKDGRQPGKKKSGDNSGEIDKDILSFD
jgi:hypothetical protein